ncbi:CoA-binding protein [Winogradskyella immobilis]|uniref:CoA-binding protein n=1 Tax=Winogradskyella immobilis TaxID=2816852 RepID=A0ABS8EQ67_9FLAO|nr:CoA-binding protein [Winogradskyella immobilis]MCC1485132.1 CoA-binding protein [Winogradskyella immobilis]MCG0017224.1 CoA-binding protein [Winogradskyella immobilis]
MKKKTLVVGASLKTHRYSNKAIRRLIDKGHEVKALGLRKGEVEGVSIDTERLNYKAIDTVTLYLNPKRQVELYDYIIGLKPKRVIFNPGTENIEFYNLLKANQIEFEIACTLVLLGTNQY